MLSLIYGIMVIGNSAMLCYAMYNISFSSLDSLSQSLTHSLYAVYYTN